MRVKSFIMIPVIIYFHHFQFYALSLQSVIIMGSYKICSKFSTKVLFFVKVIKDYNNLLYYFDQNAVKYL